MVPIVPKTRRCIGADVVADLYVRQITGGMHMPRTSRCRGIRSSRHAPRRRLPYQLRAVRLRKFRLEPLEQKCELVLGKSDHWPPEM